MVMSASSRAPQPSSSQAASTGTTPQEHAESLLRMADIVTRTNQDRREMVEFFGGMSDNSISDWSTDEEHGVESSTSPPSEQDSVAKGLSQVETVDAVDPSATTRQNGSTRSATSTTTSNSTAEMGKDISRTPVVESRSVSTNVKGSISAPSSRETSPVRTASSSPPKKSSSFPTKKEMKRQIQDLHQALVTMKENADLKVRKLDLQLKEKEKERLAWQTRYEEIRLDYDRLHQRINHGGTIEEYCRDLEVSNENLQKQLEDLKGVQENIRLEHEDFVSVCNGCSTCVGRRKRRKAQQQVQVQSTIEVPPLTPRGRKNSMTLFDGPSTPLSPGQKLATSFWGSITTSLMDWDPSLSTEESALQMVTSTIPDNHGVSTQIQHKGQIVAEDVPKDTSKSSSVSTDKEASDDASTTSASVTSSATMMDERLQEMEQKMQLDLEQMKLEWSSRSTKKNGGSSSIRRNHKLSPKRGRTKDSASRTSWMNSISLARASTPPRRGVGSSSRSPPRNRADSLGKSESEIRSLEISERDGTNNGPNDNGGFDSDGDEYFDVDDGEAPGTLDSFLNNFMSSNLVEEEMEEEQSLFSLQQRTAPVRRSNVTSRKKKKKKKKSTSGSIGVMSDHRRRWTELNTERSAVGSDRFLGRSTRSLVDGLEQEEIDSPPVVGGPAAAAERQREVKAAEEAQLHRERAEWHEGPRRSTTVL